MQTRLRPAVTTEWQSRSKRSRLLIVAAVWVTCFVMTVGVLALTTGKAHAQCQPGSSDTCPVPSAFAAKYQNGFFHRANGLPADQVFGAPDKTHDFWAARWLHKYNDAPAAVQKQMALHAAAVARNRKTRAKAERWLTRSGTARDGTCSQIPFTGPCMAQLEWFNMLSNIKCGGWNTWPNIDSDEACNRFRFPGPDQDFATWGEVETGLHLTICTVGTGAAVVTAVGSGGTAAPVVFAGLAGSDCAVTFWESFH